MFLVTNSVPKFSWRFRKSTVEQKEYLRARPRSLRKRRIRTCCPGCRIDELAAYSGPSLSGIYLKGKTKFIVATKLIKTKKNQK